MEGHNRLLEQHPDFRRVLGDLEHATRARLAQPLARAAGPVKILVVVHVVWRTQNEKIGKPQIDSQIDALNRDYRARNPDKSNAPSVWSGLATDAFVEFALATLDPSGNATNGVTYTKTQSTSFGTDDSVKSSATGGADPWPSGKYLNLWVCTLGGGLLDMRSFQGASRNRRGVILNSAFGTVGTANAPFNLGRTATHEIGHWLNLHHIWGDTEDCSGNDLVDDTPNAQHPNYGTPASRATTAPTETCS